MAINTHAQIVYKMAARIRRHVGVRRHLIEQPKNQEMMNPIGRLTSGDTKRQHYAAADRFYNIAIKWFRSSWRGIDQNWATHSEAWNTQCQITYKGSNWPWLALQYITQLTVSRLSLQRIDQFMSRSVGLQKYLRKYFMDSWKQKYLLRALKRLVLSNLVTPYPVYDVVSDNALVSHAQLVPVIETN